MEPKHLNGEWVYKNPGTLQPLRIPLNVICNTSEEEILRNVLINSKTCSRWLDISSKHDGTAILCGSGPSLADCLDEIVRLHSQGGCIFALNGAARFLNEQGIYPDYQVIMDAKPETSELVGEAREHLFASQVNPKTLEKAKNLTLWHATFGNLLPDEQEGFPKRGGYCLIGSYITVGGTSLILAYAMGYRKLHCFGYDSSHRDNRGHAFPQKINDGDPCTLVEFQGREYLSSFTMAGQARHFLGLAGNLTNLGCDVAVHGSGLLPDMYNAQWSEQDKYRLMWQFPEYREVSPGEYCLETFLYIVKPEPLAEIIDFGCGTGKALRRLHEKNFIVTGIDFAENCLNTENRLLRFRQADLSKSIPVTGQYGYCTDVMEHIPSSQIDQVIENIMQSTPQTFFQISLTEDSCGMLLGKTLHLSVHDFDWWQRKFEDLGYAVTWSENLGSDGQYYVKRSWDYSQKDNT